MEATQIDKHLFQPLGFGAGLAPVFSIVGRLVGCVAGWVPLSISGSSTNRQEHSQAASERLQSLRGHAVGLPKGTPRLSLHDFRQ